MLSPVMAKEPGEAPEGKKGTLGDFFFFFLCVRSLDLLQLTEGHILHQSLLLPPKLTASKSPRSPLPAPSHLVSLQLLYCYGYRELQCFVNQYR